MIDQPLKLADDQPDFRSCASIAAGLNAIISPAGSPLFRHARHG